MKWILSLLIICHVEYIKAKWDDPRLLPCIECDVEKRLNWHEKNGHKILGVQFNFPDHSAVITYGKESK